jgi:hypothetical protein
MKKSFLFSFVISLLAASGCVFGRSGDPAGDNSSPQAQDHNSNGADHGGFPQDPDHPENR